MRAISTLVVTFPSRIAPSPEPDASRPSGSTQSAGCTRPDRARPATPWSWPPASLAVFPVGSMAQRPYAATVVIRGGLVVQDDLGQLAQARRPDDGSGNDLLWHVLSTSRRGDRWRGSLRGWIEGKRRCCQNASIWVDESNPIRVIDAFVDALDLRKLGFEGMDPAETGRPAYHPSAHLKLYIYGYLNRVQSSRGLEREASRNVEVMWLLGRLAPITRRVSTSAETTAPPSRRCARSTAASSARQ
jgi:Transposase domain (DUF772)